MATEVINTIRASGGDYSSLTAWEAGEQGDLVSADEVAVAECYNDWSGGLAETLTVDGWTTDSTRFPLIRPASGSGTQGQNRHDGTPGSGFSISHTPANFATLVNLLTSYGRIEGIEIFQNANLNTRSSIYAKNNCILDGLVVRNAATGSGGRCLYLGNSAKARNCITFSLNSAAANETGASSTPTFSNCVFVDSTGNCTGAILLNGFTTAAAKNCVFYNFASEWTGKVSNNNINFTTCATTLASGSSVMPTGAGNLFEIDSSDFEDAANDDFHTAAGSSLIDQGTNLYSDFQYDVDEEEYPSTGDWPIGFDYVPAGGGVTGTGGLVGSGSEIVGTGTRTVTGTGALEGQGAAIVGTGERVITGTGALIGQGSDVAGTGATGGVHTGTGDLIGAGSEVVGVGERTITGTGALVAQGSAVVGVGERTVIGSGDLVGAGAEVSGTGAVGGITTGTGDLVGAGSEVVGTGLRTVTGSGALVAQGSAVTGTGERTITGAGALIGSGSEIVGAGVGGDVTTGAGALVGQGSAVTGTGTRKITGVGDLVAAGSIIVGAGVRTITGSGALVGAGSEIVGTYVATIVEPTLFQTAADTIIDVFAAAHGQTITLALDSGTVTITGFMRKRPKDWDTPDGKMRGSGWQIVCKGWEISSSDLEGMSGKRATVDGDAYYIVSATPKTSGTLVLDVGYAN